MGSGVVTLMGGGAAQRKRRRFLQEFGMLVLGIETTCDETAAAIVERDERGQGEIRSNVILSQLEAHQAFGGVVPEIAARAHVEALDEVIQAAMDQAGMNFLRLDGLAASAGAGVIRRGIIGVPPAQADSRSIVNAPLTLH